MAEKGSSSEKRLKNYEATDNPTAQLCKVKQSKLMLRKRRIATNEISGLKGDATQLSPPSGVNLKNIILASLSSDRHSALTGINTLNTWFYSSLARAPLRDEVIRAGVVLTLLGRLQEKSDSEMEYAAVQLLTNIATGTRAHSQALIDYGVVPFLVQLLCRHLMQAFHEYALYTLGNIAADGDEFRNHIISAGIQQPLLQILATTKDVPTIKSGLFCLSQLCKGFLRDRSRIYSILFKLIKEQDTIVLVDTFCTLKLFIEIDRYKAPILKQDVCYRLASILNVEPINDLGDSALELIHQLVVKGDEAYIQIMLDSSLLPALRQQLDQRVNRDEACFIILHIVRYESCQQAMINAGIFVLLVDILASGASTARHVAACVINKATTVSLRSPETIQLIVNSGCIKPLFDLLDMPDLSLVAIALRTISNILVAGKYGARGGTNIFAEEMENVNGQERIKELKLHENEMISKTASRILTYCFQPEDGIDLLFD